MKSKLFILFLCLSYISLGQNFIHLIGIESDDSEFSKGSYGAMYDSDSEKRKSKEYAPFKTIGICRNGDRIEIMSLNYLLTPTKKGFIYCTLEVIETQYKSTENELQQQKPTFEDAIEIDFEKISFINSNFYLTKGFESIVHGGASWFNAIEKINIYPLDLKEKLFNKITNYIDNSTKNKIIINTINDMKNYGFDKNINSNSILPWAGKINNHDKIYYDIDFDNNGVKIIPLTLLQGNSSRSFLAKGKAVEGQKIYHDLKLKKYKRTSNPLISFTSPDKTTKIEIVNNQITITDIKSSTVLINTVFVLVPNCVLKLKYK